MARSISANRRGVAVDVPATASSGVSDARSGITRASACDSGVPTRECGRACAVETRRPAAESTCAATKARRASATGKSTDVSAAECTSVSTAAAESAAAASTTATATHGGMSATATTAPTSVSAAAVLRERGRSRGHQRREGSHSP